MPSQKQLKWSQLRVGITVVVAVIGLMLVVFLMSSTTGLFTDKVVIRTYFDNAEGLRVGAPARLQGVAATIRSRWSRPRSPASRCSSSSASCWERSST